MSGVRLTLGVGNTDGLKFRLKAKTAKKRERLLKAAVGEAHATFDLMQALCPRDTSYMANHMVLVFTRDGFNWSIAFFARDFVGHVNPVTGKRIKIFYPVPVVKGTRTRAGNDFMTAVLRLRRAQILRSYTIAVA